MKWLVCSMAVVGTFAHAFTEESIDEKKPIHVILSTKSHNRIGVAGGAVEKIFADSELFSVRIDPTTGHAFVNVLREIGADEVTMTVVTSSGAIQDLAVLSSSGPSETVLLKEVEEEEWKEGPMLSHALTIEFLNEVLEGKIPHGYGERAWENQEDRSLPGPLSIVGVKALEGPFETIYIYEIVNQNKKPVVIDPEAIKQDKDAWVFLNTREIHQGEKAICLIGQAKE